MRIALLSLDRGVPFGGSRKGASVHLQSLAGSLLRAGHTVSVRCADQGDRGAVGALLAQGLDLRALEPGATPESIAAELRAIAPALVIERLSLSAPEGALGALAAGVPHVYEVNAPLDEEAARHRGLADPAAARAALARGFAASGGAVAVSDEVATWVRAIAPGGFPVTVEPNGAGPEFFAAPPAADVARVRERLSLSAAEFTIGFVGAFRPWHDLPTLIAAAGELARERAVRLVLVGDGPSRDEVLRLADVHGAPVTLAGLVAHDQVPAYLALMDAVAVPYASADAYFSPLKLFEAMAAGCAIVASATHPVTRVAEDHRHALLAAPGDARAMAAALRELAADSALRGRLGANARRAAESRHHWDAIAERVVAFALRAARPAEESCGN